MQSKANAESGHPENAGNNGHAIQSVNAAIGVGMTRPKFTTRTFYLVNGQVQQTLIAAITNLPIDHEKPLEVVIREKQKARTPDQNSRMWAGALRDLAEQAYIEGRTYSAEVWHEYLKREYLPEEFDAELCKEGYRKWDYTPSGERVLVGSTTQLTKKGMAQYMEQLHAHGANLGVMFSAAPGERWAA